MLHLLNPAVTCQWVAAGKLQGGHFWLWQSLGVETRSRAAPRTQLYLDGQIGRTGSRLSGAADLIYSIPDRLQSWIFVPVALR